MKTSLTAVLCGSVNLSFLLVPFKDVFSLDSLDLYIFFGWVVFFMQISTDLIKVHACLG